MTKSAQDNQPAQTWKQFVVDQPPLTEAERRGELDGVAASFTIELADESVLLKIKLEDGRTDSIELSADKALYLREYLSNALATIDYGR